MTVEIANDSCDNEMASCHSYCTYAAMGVVSACLGPTVLRNGMLTRDKDSLSSKLVDVEDCRDGENKFDNPDYASRE